jgi:DNA-directed RNA polymerase subunit RPC12/RpoP
MGYLSNYGLMIPQGPYREPKKPDSNKWLCRIIGHRWERYMITTMDRHLPHKCKRCGKITSVQWPFRLKSFLVKSGDFLLHPICYLSSHRWISTYGYTSYSYATGLSKKIEEEQHYVCGRCGKKKTVKIS